MKNHHHNGPHFPNPTTLLHEAIAARAYDVWLDAGKPENRADACWLQAEREIVSGHRTPPADRILPVSF
jgi:hypothetical protein